MIDFVLSYQKKRKEMNYFTNERFKNKFKSNFDLVNYAIKISKAAVEGSEEVKSLSEILQELEGLPDIL